MIAMQVCHQLSIPKVDTSVKLWLLVWLFVKDLELQIFQFISPNLRKDILTRKLEIYCQRRFAPTGNWSQLKTPHNNNRSQQRTPNAKGDLPNEQTKVSTGWNFEHVLPTAEVTNWYNCQMRLFLQVVGQPECQRRSALQRCLEFQTKW